MRTVDSLKKGNKHIFSGLHISFAMFYRISILYLAIPVIVFFIGYLKLVLAILFSGLVISAGVWSIRRCEKDNGGSVSDEARGEITITPSFFAFIVIGTILVLYWGGVSEFGCCSSDHRVRYAILNDLVHYKWPIVYDFSTQQNPAVIEILGEGKAAFAYYFVFWMIPAVVGKLFGVMAARITLFIWSAIGLILVAIGVSLLYKRTSKVMFMALIFFAGFDVIPYVYNRINDIPTTWEGWNLHLYIHGNFFQIMNVFNQSIPGWLITILLMMSVNSFSIGMLGGLMFCYSPWATIGILPLCICKMIINIRGQKAEGSKSKRLVRGIVSPGNLIIPIVCFICFASLYTANSNATGSNGFIWNFYSSKLTLIKEYLSLFVFDYGIWLLLILRFAPQHRKDPMLWTAVGTLLILPIYKISIANDFLMRGSLSPMFIISVYSVMMVADQFEICRKSASKLSVAIMARIILILAIVAAYTPGNQMLYSALTSYRMNFTDEPYEYEQDMIGSFGNILKEDQLEMVRTQFYVYDYEDTIFFKYLAR